MARGKQRPRSGREAPSAVRFPFSAVVGQDDVKVALLLNAVDPSIGGVLLRGQKGSAKSTLARALASLLPGGAPFVELPVGATEDRLVGTFDLRAALSEGVQRFTPGLLASAHGGVLYVDEVNLLPDHLVDVLLDVAASGVNRVERDGVSHEHPSRFVLAGSMNPEEGELRPQLLDRFGLAVEVAASCDPAVRAEAVARRLAFDADPMGFMRDWEVEEGRLRARLREITGTRGRAWHAGSVPDEIRTGVSVVCAQMGVEGLRADIVMCRAAAALARWEEREVATLDDVARVAPLALAHRRRRSPLERHGADSGELERALEAAGGLMGSGSRPGGGGPEGGGPGTRPDPAAAEGGGQGEGAAEAVAAPVALFPVPGVLGGGDRPPSRAPGILAGGRRRAPTVESARGRTVGARVPAGEPASLAARATVMAAATRMPGGVALAVEPCDLREQVRREAPGRLVVFALDVSGSMGVAERVAATKGAVAGLLLDAHALRDRVALVAFRGDGAEVVLSPTGSVEVAAYRLDQIVTGGSTPLAAGILRALEVAEGAVGDGRRAVLVVVTDGRASWADGGTDALDAALDAARRVRLRGFEAVVVDAEQGRVRLGLASRIATAMGARYVDLEGLASLFGQDGGSLAHHADS